MITGHKSTDKDNLNKAESATVNPIQHKRMGADSLSWISAYEVTSGVLASGSTTSTISITGIESFARAGDFLYIGNRVLSVISVSASSLLIGQFLASVPTAGTAYSLRRYLPPLLNSNGETIVTPASGSLTNVNITQYGSVATSLGQKTSAASIPTVLSSEQETILSGRASETTLSTINTKLVGGTTIGDVRIRDGSGNVLVSTTSAPDTTDRGLITKAVCHAAADGGFGTTPITAYTDTPDLFAAGVTTRSILYTTDGFTNTRVSSDASGRINVLSRTYDSSANGINSGVASVSKTIRGLATRHPSETEATRAGAAVTFTSPQGYAFYSSRTTTTGSTTSAIVCTVDPSTACVPGDLILQTSGTLAQGIYQSGIVQTVDATTITLRDNRNFGVAPPSGVSIFIYKPSFIQTTALGVTQITGSISGSVSSVAYGGQAFYISEYGELDFVAIAAGAGGYVALAGPLNVWFDAYVSNGTDVDVWISFDGGVSDFIPLASKTSIALRPQANGMYIDGTPGIYVRYMKVAPTIGNVAIAGQA